jgi:2-phosphosulfolactate phosphatase
MEIVKIRRDEAASARGIVVVIDVIRAFSVAGYAFAGKAKGIWLVRTVEEAMALRELDPSALLMGEVGGRLIPGFDLNNSPTLIAATDLEGRQLIQRTGAGTQGAVGAAGATHTLLCALTNAQATADYARSLAAASGEPVTLLATGTTSGEGRYEEDDICADFVAALLQNRRDEAQDILARGVAHLEAINRFAEWKQGSSDFPLGDIDAVLSVNRFDFAISGTFKEWQGITYVDAQRVNLAHQHLA